MTPQSRNNRALFSRFYTKELPPASSSQVHDSLEEARRAVLPFLKKGSASIAIYGLGLGYYFEALWPWLASSISHQIVFIEEDLAKVQFFLNSERAEMLLTHPQVSIVVNLDDESLPFLANLGCDFYFLALPHYQPKAANLYADLLNRVYSLQAYLSDLWLYKEQANFYYHLTALDEYRSSIGLEKTFNHLSLIICGAGPSIQQKLSQLKGTYAVLTAAGTGLNLLNQAGIEVDFGVAFDPKPSGLRRMQSNSAFKTPYIVDIDSIGTWYLNGPKVLTWQKTEAKWKHRLLDVLGIKEQLLMVEPAITSTHYVLELALKLGFSIQVLVGVDLAYVEGQQYPGKKTWLSDEDPVRSDSIEVVSKDRRPLTVSSTYFKEAIIYSDLVQKHPEIQFFNASTHGQTIHGMRPIGDLTFSREEKNVLETFLKQPLLNTSLTAVKSLLLSWKEELNSSELLEGYQKRLELKFEAKRRYLTVMKRKKEIQGIEKQMRQFYQKVIHWHREAIEEAILEINDKIKFPKQEKRDEIPYKEGKLEGKVKLYYSNGQLKSESDFINGKREGIFRFYSRAGQLMEEGRYTKGIPVGKYIKWNRKGEIETEVKSGTPMEMDVNSIKQLLKEL